MIGRLADRLLGGRCPICRERTKCLRVHIDVNHSEVGALMKERDRLAAQVGAVVGNATFGKEIRQLREDHQRSLDEWRREKDDE